MSEPVSTKASPTENAGELGTARVFLLVNLASEFDGQLSPLLVGFGAGTVLLQATVDRLVAAQVAPIVVCFRDNAENRQVHELLRDRDVQLRPFANALEGLDMVASTMSSDRIDHAVVVDARAGFVSGSLLKAQLQSHREKGKPLTLVPLTPRGLGGVVASLDAVRAWAAAVARERQTDPSLDQFSSLQKLRSTFEVNDAVVDERYSCVAVSLIPRSVEEAEAASKLAMAADDESYGPLLDQLCRTEWERWPRPKGRLAPKQRPKILFVHYTGSVVPGSTRAFETMLAHWDRERYEMVVAVPTRGALFKSVHPRFPTRIVPVRWIGATTEPVAGRRWFDEASACIELLTEERPSLVFISGAVPAMAFACRTLGIPTLCHLHIPLLSLPPATSSALAQKAGLPLCDQVASTAKWFERRLRATFRPPPGRLGVVECGINLQRFTPGDLDREVAKERLGLPAGKKVISLVGTLTPLKRPELAIDTLAEVVSERDDVVLVLTGEERSVPGYRARLDERAAALGVRDRVIYLGFREDVHTVYTATDVLLHCADTEPFGLTIVEAMAMERPVVAVNACGPSETVADGTTGRLVPAPGEARAFGAAITEILADPDLARQMGLAGRQRVAELFTAERMVRRLQRACDHLLEGAPAESL